MVRDGQMSCIYLFVGAVVQIPVSHGILCNNPMWTIPSVGDNFRCDHGSCTKRVSYNCSTTGVFLGETCLVRCNVGRLEGGNEWEAWTCTMNQTDLFKTTWTPVSGASPQRCIQGCLRSERNCSAVCSEPTSECVSLSASSPDAACGCKARIAWIMTEDKVLNVFGEDYHEDK